MTIETFKSPNPRNWNSVSVMKSKFFFRLFDEHFARHFESHWLESWRHTGWRTVAHISLETPRKYGPPPPPSPHHWFCLCCFLTVSCLINAMLASFNILVSQLLRKIQGKTRPYYAARRKSYKNYLHSTSIAPKLRLSTERRFSFLQNVNLVPNIEPCPQEDEKCR